MADSMNTPAGMGTPPPQTQDPQAGNPQQLAQQPTQNMPVGQAPPQGIQPVGGPGPGQQTVTVPAAEAASAAKTHFAWKALMGNHDQWVPGPDGVPVNNPQPNNAKQLFRSILAGAIMGMGAGAESKMGGGVGSFAVGASAGMQQQQAQKQRDQQQAQQQWENQQAASKENREKMLADANLAQMTAQTARWNHENDLQDQAAHEAHNKASAVLVSSLTDPKVGGHDPSDGSLPGTISAAELAKKYMENPKLRHAPNPDTEQRHFIDTSDATEVQWADTANGGKGGWVDDGGNPVNMTDKTMFRVIDVPRDTQNTKIPTSGADLNALAHLPKGSEIYDPKTMYPVSALDKKAIFQDGLARQLEQSKIDVENRRIGAQEDATRKEEQRQRQTAFEDFQRTITETNANLKDQLKEETNPTVQASLRKQIADNDAALATRAAQMEPGAKSSKSGNQSQEKTEPLEPTSLSPSEKVLQDTMSYTPDTLKPVVSGLLNGSPLKAANGSVVPLPSASTLASALSNLATYQSTVSSDLKLKPTDYQKTVDLLKSHFERVPVAQSSEKNQADEERYIRLHALNPKITRENMKRYKDDGTPYVRQTTY